MVTGGVVPTLNAFDNATETRATVLIFYGNRVDDIRLQKNVINTLQARMGTGGGNMPIVAFSVREDAKANNFSATETDTALTLQGHQPSPQSHHAQIFITENQSTVRRLTPTECERLQGFPDGWTAERFDEKKQTVVAQADSNRYKQMGNAVAVPVVDWIIKRLVANQ
jgi:DNA (cytosine-5)-methyltransferase 1